MDRNPDRSLVERIAALEAEVTQLRSECAQLRARVECPPRAPFRVVDEAGKTLFEVARRGPLSHLRLFDPEGHFLVTLAGIPSGGCIAIHDPAGAEVVGIASGKRGGTIAISDRSAQLVGWMNVTDGGGHIVTRDSSGTITSMHPTPGDSATAEPKLTEAASGVDEEDLLSAAMPSG